MLLSKRINIRHEVCFWGVIALFLLVVNFWSYRTQVNCPVYEESGVEYDENAEFDFTLPFLSRSDEFVQKFVPVRPYLETIKLRFALSTEEEFHDSSITFFIGIYDSENVLIWDSKIVPVEVEDLQYGVYEVDRNVNAGEPYQLKIHPEFDVEMKNDRPISIHCFLSTANLKENQGCSWNGETLSGNVDIVYQYKYYDIQAFYKIIFVDFLLFVCIFVLKLLERKLQTAKRQKAVGWIMWGITPLTMYCIFESIIGNFSTIQNKYVAINILLFYILYLVFSLGWKRLRISADVFAVVLLIVALAQYYVMLFRGRPFMLFDVINIKTAFTVSDSYVFEMPVRLAVCLQAFLGLVAAQHILQKMSFPENRVVIAVRVLGIGIFVSIIAAFLNTGVMGRLGFEGVDFWNLNGNYEEKGTLYTLLLECAYNNVEKPKGYSPERAEVIAVSSETEDKSVVQPENLIVIMNESLADFESIQDLATDEEILPYLHSMKDNTIKGWLQMPVFGAGTAESEYEFLTGNSKQFLASGSTAYEIYCQNPEYGMAWSMKQQGYRTIALHPYWSTNWNRSSVYPEMGFDEFYGIENWGEDIENIRWCASDKSAYEKIKHLIEEKDQGEKMFTFLVTMQNHGGYGEDTFNEFIPSVSLNYETVYPFTEAYLSLIKESDSAFHELVSYFEKVDEPTMIVMFGDHLPAVEEEFYSELFGEDMNNLDMEQSQVLYQTPYVIWTNYEHESKKDENMSANYLSSYVLQQAGLELTPYNKFLLNLKDTLPVIGMGAVCNHSGKWYAMDELTKEYEALITQYKTIQYNNVIDRRHIQSNIFTLSDEE